MIGVVLTPIDPAVEPDEGLAPGDVVQMGRYQRKVPDWYGETSTADVMNVQQILKG